MGTLETLERPLGGDRSVWVCPACLGELDWGIDHARCDHCRLSFRVWKGIPDLRHGPPDPFMSVADDRRIADQLIQRYDEEDFLGLLRRLFELSGVNSESARRRQLDHIQTAPDRGGPAIQRLVDGTGETGGLFLDLGCGSGSFLSHAASIGQSRSQSWIGIDVAWRWLILARKLLDERGVDRVDLACAQGERLPLRDGSLAGILAGDVIEHVANAQSTIEECHRVLRTGGRLLLSTPNRYSIALEPHVGVWGVGWMPRRWMPTYVRWCNNADFRAITTRGARDWARLFRRSPFAGAVIVPPRIPSEQVARFRPPKRAAAALYHWTIRWTWGRSLSLALGPILEISATRSLSTGPTNPATHPRSTPSASPGPSASTPRTARDTPDAPE